MLAYPGNPQGAPNNVDDLRLTLGELVRIRWLTLSAPTDHYFDSMFGGSASGSIVVEAFRANARTTARRRSSHAELAGGLIEH
jgi:hypothetical protein